MFWEKNKDLLIIVLLGILTSIPIWIFLWYETDKLIQSQLIIVLIVITIYYAIQTQKLVKQEKISLEEEKRKRSVDFLRERLIEFYLPLKFNLLKLQEVIQYKPFPIDEYIKIISEFTEIMSKGYMLTAEMNNSLISFMSIFKFQIRDKVEDRDKYYINEQTEEFLKKVNLEIHIFEYKIKEVYGLYIDKKLQDYIDKLRVEIYSGRR